MRTLCTTNMPFATEAFGTLGDVRAVDGRTITAADLADVDILAVRSTTQITPDFIQGPCLKFIGTATIGIDHIAREIRESTFPWASSPGCNATSVAEWITAVLLEWAVLEDRTLEGLTLGIVGVGQVGSRVAAKAEALGLRVLLNDPPRARAEGMDGFCELPQLLAESDIVTLHTPLEREGMDPTWHLADEAFFAAMKCDALFMNAARGPIVESDALRRVIDAGEIGRVVLDTWEGEPIVRADLLERVWLATPHIAGYSFEGKAMGTAMVYDAACAALGVQGSWSIDDCWPEPPVPELMVSGAAASFEGCLLEAVRPVYDVRADDLAFRAVEEDAAEARGVSFDRFRKEYPMRREFRFTELEISPEKKRLQQVLQALGFRVA